MDKKSSSSLRRLFKSKDKKDKTVTKDKTSPKDSSGNTIAPEAGPSSPKVEVTLLKLPEDILFLILSHIEPLIACTVCRPWRDMFVSRSSDFIARFRKNHPHIPTFGDLAILHLFGSKVEAQKITTQEQFKKIFPKSSEWGEGPVRRTKKKRGGYWLIRYNDSCWSEAEYKIDRSHFETCISIRNTIYDEKNPYILFLFRAYRTISELPANSKGNFFYVYEPAIPFSSLYHHTWSEREVQGFAFQLFSALKCLHHHGIAHRNIRPDSIMMIPQGDSLQLKLGYFDYSSTQPREDLRRERNRPITCGGEVTSYTAVEGYADGQQLQYIPADIWAATCFVFEQLFDDQPFASLDVHPMRRLFMVSAAYRLLKIEPLTRDLLSKMFGAGTPITPDQIDFFVMASLVTKTNAPVLNRCYKQNGLQPQFLII